MKPQDGSNPGGAMPPNQVRALLEAEDAATERTFYRGAAEHGRIAEYDAAAKEKYDGARQASASGVDRRDFMKFAGTTLAVAGLTGCTRPPLETIVPYVDAPEDVIPGKPLFFATSMPQRGLAHPLVVESHMGRPTKVDGNDRLHGSSASNVYAQASILDLYDPDRSTNVRGPAGSWQGFLNVMANEANSWKESFVVIEGGNVKTYKGLRPFGKGVHILMAPTSSASVAKLVEEFLAAQKEAKLYVHDPLAAPDTSETFGGAFRARYHLDKASVVLDLAADCLNPALHPATMAAGWAAGRNFVDHKDELVAGGMNRLYAVETDLSLTGAAAEHRLALSPSGVAAFVEKLAGEFGVAVEGKAAAAPEGNTDGKVTEIDVSTGQGSGAKKDAGPYGDRFLRGLLADLRAAEGKAVLVAGEHLPAGTQATIHKINEAIGALGETVDFIESPFAQPESAGTIDDLGAALAAGEVDTLLVLGCNPVYDAPGSLEIGRHLKQKPPRLSIHLGRYRDETAELCEWHIPATHYLEEWGDARTHDGTLVPIQPLIAPLYPDAKSLIDMFHVLLGKPDSKAYDHVKATLGLEEAAWRKALHDGFVPDSAPAAASPTFTATAAEPASTSGMELQIVPDPTAQGGETSNNMWLQETPAPVSTLTWDAVAKMSPATAKTLKVAGPTGSDGYPKRVTTNDRVPVVKVKVGDAEVTAPVLVQPGHADGCVTLSTGYGRGAKALKTAAGIGYNAFSLMTEAARWQFGGAVIDATKDIYPLALTQDHFRIREGRALALGGTLKMVQADEGLIHYRSNQHVFPQDLTLYRKHNDTRTHQVYTNERLAGEGTQWGMCIDLGRCVACNACVTACQAENNTSTVGKTEVMNGREMHWIRVDRYYEGDPAKSDEVAVHTQPVACQHCEEAGCEVVCPVGATVHSNEGLNQMVYNRCVGTRYCSNNCPYKVRRFNFFQYADLETESLKLARNPNVSVRARGVMEKCTFCVQRINAARVAAKIDPAGPREIRDGEVVTACQAACPTKAIAFGNLCDEESEVVKYREGAAKHLNYQLLAEVNMRPRTNYIVRVKNPNPEIVDEPVHEYKEQAHHIHAKHGGGH